MPRTKGSKNKSSLPLEERIAAVTAELSALQEQVKAKKAELKKLNAEKDAEDQQKVLDAFVISGRSADEVIAMLRGEGQ